MCSLFFVSANSQSFSITRKGKNRNASESPASRAKQRTLSYIFPLNSILFLDSQQKDPKMTSSPIPGKTEESHILGSDERKQGKKSWRENAKTVYIVASAMFFLVYVFQSSLRMGGGLEDTQANLLQTESSELNGQADMLQERSLRIQTGSSEVNGMWVESKHTREIGDGAPPVQKRRKRKRKKKR